MKVFVAHNYYREEGGEDYVFQTECALLDARGHQVIPYTADNDHLPDRPGVREAMETVWNEKTYDDLRELFRRERPDIAHFHNTFPLISPSAYHAARKEGIPIVQTLHNYRLLCPSAQFFRDGRVCEDCLGRAVPWPGVVHACYRDNRAATGAIATMLSGHRLLGTWRRTIGRYIALTEFAREKFIEGGLPGSHIHVKPNFLNADPGAGSGAGGYALFAGRLSVEKGLDVLLSAWERIGDTVPLKIVGDGPLAERVRAAADRLPGVEWLGRRPREEVFRLMQGAHFLVFPSVWYEGFPLVVVEAFAMGLPVVASNLGNMSSIIADGWTGLHFRPGDPVDLAAKSTWLASTPEARGAMRLRAREEYQAKYTADRNYSQLMAIYAAARNGNGRARP
ncbi:MAG: glycosyltransferase [Gemmatimonadota bacterium]